MKVLFSLASNNEENKMIKTAFSDMAAKHTDIKWEYYLFDDLMKALGFLKGEPVVDYLSFDITRKENMDRVETVRKNYKSAFVILVADSSISPMTYLKPSIAPGALILKPLTLQNCQKVFDDVLASTLDSDDNEVFVIETREDKQIVPYKQIDCFEARDKKIYARVKNKEFCFYDSLDELQQRLPDSFLRCHRSFIANMDRVRSINNSESYMEMIDKAIVPISRSYKKEVNDYVKK